MTSLLTTYTEPKQFLSKVQTYLEKDEAANGLMLGLAFRLQQFAKEIQRPPYLATVEDEEGLVAVGLMTPPHKLIVYSDRNMYDEALTLIARNLQADGWTVPGVLGPEAIALSYATIWSRLLGIEYRPGMRQRIFELREVIWPSNLNSGELRIAIEADLPLVTDWVMGFNKEALHQTIDVTTAREMAHGHIRFGQLYIWDRVKQPVSMALRTRPTRHGISISLVYTPPAERSRGYASACVASLSQLLLDEGYQFCTLVTDLSNPTSNRIYTAIGYKAIIDYIDYFFETDTTDS